VVPIFKFIPIINHRKAKAEMLAVGEKSIAEKLGIATADTKVDIAENKLNVAMQHVQKAEHDLKLAKGEKINDGFMGTGWFKDWDSRVENKLFFYISTIKPFL
jgi:hypothetical protein